MTLGIISGLPGDELYGIPLLLLKGVAYDFNFPQGLLLLRS